LNYQERGTENIMKGPRVVIACHVMEPEIKALQPDKKGVEVRYLEQRLHDIPKQMPSIIQAQIDEVKDYASQIVLGYGFCSNGVVGLAAPNQALFIPKAHDCIALFLGSHESYLKVFNKNPGTYYLTPGWVAEKKDPVGYMVDMYEPRYGRETAEMALKEEFKNYTNIALIDTQVADIEPLRERALENSRFLNLKYKEIVGTLDYLKKILFGPYDENDFFVFQPGETVSADPFLWMPNTVSEGRSALEVS
jgi:Protein of unknown function (DUF1638)